jgi:hypothetical protein
MYKGKITYFYNGEILWDEETEEFLIYDEEERKTWEVIIVLPGVEVIPKNTFCGCDNGKTVGGCKNVKTVIMSDSVKRIESWAFSYCGRLEFVRLSSNLEYIGSFAFEACRSLSSIFIPPSCREISDSAFYMCTKLIILSVPRQTQLGEQVIGNTAFIKASPFEVDENGYYYDHNEEVNEWIKNLNQAEEFALHRECASIEPPSEENIYEIINHQGLPSIHVKNEIGLTAFEYLQKNPYTENQIDQHKLIKRYILDLMEEIIIT